MDTVEVISTLFLFNTLVSQQVDSLLDFPVELITSKLFLVECLIKVRLGLRGFTELIAL
jgi:hypothetical protein